MSLHTVLTRPLRAVLGLLEWVGANPLRVAGALAALGASGYLYGVVAAAREVGTLAAVAAHPAYALLAVAGLGAFLLLR